MGSDAEGLEALGAEEIRELCHRVRDAFAAHRDEIDALNVFPVPDGDTGTNLYLTARSAVDEAEEETPRAFARGALLGARGNSGVIYSQVVRALADAFDERGALDAVGIADALARAREHAYESVAKPVEGTMLTAIAAAAEAAADPSGDLAAVVEEVAEAVADAVARTPEQLDVLREAGVVDAGARGFEVFCATLAAVVRGEAAREDTRAAPVVRRSAPGLVERETGSPEFRYEVQYLLDATDDEAEILRDRLGRIGDSVVVVSAGDLLNVHVHTNDIGQAIEEGIALGRPSRIEVTAFDDQIRAASEEEDEGEEASAAGSERTDEVGGRLGCVVVLPGPGLAELAEEMGATVLDGVAGDLPSVSDLLEAMRRTSGERLVVVPGHRNVVPAAEQAAKVTADEDGRSVEVLRAATSPTRALAALALWDPDEELESVVELMADAAGAVRSGEIVAAVRDASTPIGDVREGTFLAVVDGDVVAADDDPVEALRALAESCTCADAEVVTLVLGADVDDDERERAVAALEDLTSAEIDVIDGGQAPARYLLGSET